jgi:hypothetical protein
VNELNQSIIPPAVSRYLQLLEDLYKWIAEHEYYPAMTPRAASRGVEFLYKHWEEILVCKYGLVPQRHFTYKQHKKVIEDLSRVLRKCENKTPNQLLCRCNIDLLDRYYTPYSRAFLECRDRANGRLNSPYIDRHQALAHLERFLVPRGHRQSDLRDRDFVNKIIQGDLHDVRLSGDTTAALRTLVAILRAFTFRQSQGLSDEEVFYVRSMAALAGAWHAYQSDHTGIESFFLTKLEQLSQYRFDIGIISKLKAHASYRDPTGGHSIMILSEAAPSCFPYNGFDDGSHDHNAARDILRMGYGLDDSLSKLGNLTARSLLLRSIEKGRDDESALYGLITYAHALAIRAGDLDAAAVVIEDIEHRAKNFPDGAYIQGKKEAIKMDLFRCLYLRSKNVAHYEIAERSSQRASEIFRALGLPCKVHQVCKFNLAIDPRV